MQGANRRHHCERVQHTCKFTMDCSIYSYTRVVVYRARMTAMHSI